MQLKFAIVDKTGEYKRREYLEGNKESCPDPLPAILRSGGYLPDISELTAAGRWSGNPGYLVRFLYSDLDLSQDPETVRLMKENGYEVYTEIAEFRGEFPSAFYYYHEEAGTRRTGTLYRILEVPAASQTIEALDESSQPI